MELPVLVAVSQVLPANIVALGVGLISVVLARWVFVNRENRVLPRKQPWRETLPLTLSAMLITGVVITDRKLGLSGAMFTGFGVGWAVVLLLDLFGERVVSSLRAGFAHPVPPPVAQAADHSGHDGQALSADFDLPPDMLHHVDALMHVPGTRDKGTPDQ